MKSQTITEASTTQACPSRFSARRRFAVALGSILAAGSGLALAQDGVHELRNPIEMEKVPPVRAVGIRLSPAAPINLDATAPPKLTSPNESAAPPNAVATRVLPPIRPAATAAPAVLISPAMPIDPTAAASPSTLSLPPAPPSLTATALPTDTPTFAIPSSPENVQAKRPERVIPKSKVSVAISENAFAKAPLIKLQSPLEVQPEPEGIRTASAPLPSKPSSVVVEGLVATESKLIAEEMAQIHLAPPSTKHTASNIAMELPTTAPMPISIPDIEKATRIDLDTQSTREIRIDFPIQSLAVSNEHVCRAMASGGCVYVVGLSIGESIIEVRASNSDPSQYLRVKVVAPWQRSSGVTDLDQLVHAIQPLSQNNALTVRAQEDGSVVVQGVVANKETAKRIMELTRKLILVPVVDKLEVR